MFSQSDLFVTSFVPLILVIVSGGITAVECLIKDKVFLSPWLTLGTSIICTGVLIFMQAHLSDLLIYLTSVLAIRLVISLIIAKKDKKDKTEEEKEVKTDDI